MKIEQDRKELLSLYEETLKVGQLHEGIFLLIDSLLKEDPDCIDAIVDRFHHPNEKDDKETLAHIILKVLHYQPAIDYMKSIGEDDFTGYAGFPES
jgi:hypothetical protein